MVDDSAQALWINFIEDHFWQLKTGIYGRQIRRMWPWLCLHRDLKIHWQSFNFFKRQ